MPVLDPVCCIRHQSKSDKSVAPKRTANLVVSLAFGPWVNLTMHARFPRLYITQTPDVLELLDHDFKIWINERRNVKEVPKVYHHANHLPMSQPK